ncbi:MAG: response regulator [Butyrivibrio sp.]|nr:response regulator [Butyrivibrio sp.]
MSDKYKVVIVDDEPVIAKGLRQMLNWDSYGCEVVAMAGSGQEGLKAVSEHDPDILFTDIRMPGIDGLTMIAALKSEHKDMQITILTGFRDFEYARRAISLGVHRFLLKPSKLDELDESLRTMVEKLREIEPIKERADGDEDSVKESTEEAGAAGNFIVKNALEYIEENYREKIQLTDVAEHVYVSVWHLSKLLNSVTGKNFSEILNGIRIDQAKKLLRDPSLSISEIAEQVGFLDMAHFSRVFKKHVGVSANEYRNGGQQ